MSAGPGGAAGGREVGRRAAVALLVACVLLAVAAWQHDAQARAGAAFTYAAAGVADEGALLLRGLLVGSAAASSPRGDGRVPATRSPPPTKAVEGGASSSAHASPTASTRPRHVGPAPVPSHTTPTPHGTPSRVAAPSPAAWTPADAAARYRKLPFHPVRLAEPGACWRSPYAQQLEAAARSAGGPNAPLRAGLHAVNARLVDAVRFSDAGTAVSAAKAAACAAAKPLLLVGSPDECPLGRMCLRGDPPAAAPNRSLSTTNELGYELCTHTPWGYSLLLQNVRGAGMVAQRCGSA